MSFHHLDGYALRLLNTDQHRAFLPVGERAGQVVFGFPINIHNPPMALDIVILLGWLPGLGIG